MVKVKERIFQPPVMPDVIRGVLINAKAVRPDLCDQRRGEENGEEKIGRN